MLLPGCAHQDFPDATTSEPGVRTLQARRDARHVHVHLGVPYTTASGRQLHLHVIQSCLDLTWVGWDEMAAERLPCVVFVPGSGWQEQELGSGMDFWVRFAHRGYVVVLVEYRPSTVAPFPAQVADAETAVRWLVDNHHRFGIDPTRMALAGDSSGGHTALMVHATHPTAPLPASGGGGLGGGGHGGGGHGSWPVRAYLDFYGPTDLAIGNQAPTTVDHEGPDSAEGLLFGGVDVASVPGLVRRANPTARIQPGVGLAPLLMVHGTRDRVVGFEHSLRHYRALREAGQPVELVQVSDGDHGFTAAMFTDELADLVDDFLRAALDPGQARPEGSGAARRSEAGGSGGH